jgi:hypothetical protein
MVAPTNRRGHGFASPNGEGSDAAVSSLAAEPSCEFFKSELSVTDGARTKNIPATSALLAPHHLYTAQNILASIAFALDFVAENRVMPAVIPTKFSAVARYIATCDNFNPHRLTST